MYEFAIAIITMQEGFHYAPVILVLQQVALFCDICEGPLCRDMPFNSLPAVQIRMVGGMAGTICVTNAAKNLEKFDIFKLLFRFQGKGV